MADCFETARIDDGGRIVIPARFRKALEIKPGELVNLELVDGELRVRSRRAALRRAQEIVAPYLREGHSMVDELIAERREESRRESLDG